MKNILLSLIPTKLQHAIAAHARHTWRQQQQEIARQMPLHLRLQEAQLANCTLLPDRTALLHRLPKEGVVAEIGVDTGTFSSAIRDICHPQKLHLVDAWDTTRYGEDKASSVRQRFADAIAAGQVEIHRGYSTHRAADFSPEYFDWIYIDTDHSYATTRDELRLYAPLVKQGGIIAGHDFIKGNWLSGYRYGVMEAVFEFCTNNSWELLYLTMELDDHPSFAIRKMV